MDEVNEAMSSRNLGLWMSGTVKHGNWERRNPKEEEQCMECGTEPKKSFYLLHISTSMSLLAIRFKHA